MNSQEREQLIQLLKPLVEYKLPSKDSDAENLIHQAVARQPDAAYLLVQRVLLLEHALNNAKTQITELQKQISNQSNSNSFLGNDPWAQPASNSAVNSNNYQAPRYAAPAQPIPQTQSGGLFGGSGSSFLGNIATTAAGVAAGSFLFQGIENLFGHHGGGFGSAGGFGQFPGEQITEQTVINNYYGDDEPSSQFSNAGFSNDEFSNNDDSDLFSDSGDSDWI